MEKDIAIKYFLVMVDLIKGIAVVTIPVAIVSIFFFSNLLYPVWFFIFTTASVLFCLLLLLVGHGLLRLYQKLTGRDEYYNISKDIQNYPRD